MYESSETQSRTSRPEAAFRAVLPRAANLKVSATKGPDASVVVSSRRIKLRWVGRAGLREVRDVLELQNQPDVIVGSEFSLAARALATEAGLGWVDETGAAELAVGNIVISRAGFRRPKTYAAGWSPAVTGVAEALLCGVPATVAATAEATGHSTSSVAEALAALTKWGLLEARVARGPRSGRRIVDPDRLLDEYAEAVLGQRPKVELRCGVLWRDPLVTLKQLGETWDSAGITWATTGTVAAAVLAPYLTDVTTGDIYVDARTEPDVRNAARAAQVEPMDGGRLVLRPFPTQSSRRLATAIDGMRVAPWPRVYADLRQIGVRGEEAAEHLKEVIRGQL
ncbi:MAG: hypothetical protein ACYCS7_07835 [Acidimicrobiales bacterium]